MHPVFFEVCVETADAAMAAERGGADRVELCAGLGEGGTTPSLGTLTEVRERVDIGVVVMIRPRRGDFLYSGVEFATMLRDVEIARDAGADGVALGVLTRRGDVDYARLLRLIEAARPMTVTFHRAFDHCRHPHIALSVLVELGVERVLTSGGATDAMSGLTRIAELVRASRGRLSVMPGGGVRPQNIAAIVEGSGVHEVHFSASTWRDSRMSFRNEGCTVADEDTLYRRRHVTADEVRRYRTALN